MKNIGRKSLNLSLDLLAVATGVISILNFFKKKPNVKKDNLCDGAGMVPKLPGDGTDNQTGSEHIRLDTGSSGRGRQTCHCGQPGCDFPADNDTDGK